MVKQGGYSVKLIHPHTKIPYKEHSKDGKHYCEVEPGSEYLIEFEVLEDAPRSFGDQRESALVYVRCQVDGVNLSYYETLSAGEKGEAGYYEYQNGVEKETALRFERPKIQTESSFDARSTSSAPPGGLTGKVVVRFSEAIIAGLRQRSTCWSSESVNAVIAGPPGEGASGKVVRSGQGSWSTSLAVEEEEEETYHEEGKHLETVTIHYCTCLGLIYAKILPQPPFWEHARLVAPLNEPLDPKVAKTTAKRIKLEPLISGDGTVIRQEEYYDYFDLAEASDSELESANEEAHMDLTCVLNDGTIPPAQTQEEKSVDKFFIMNFHGKLADSFRQDCRDQRKAAVRQSTGNVREDGHEYKRIVERHTAWEKVISDIYFS